MGSVMGIVEAISGGVNQLGGRLVDALITLSGGEPGAGK